jgi:hypothetical protein
MNVQKRRVGASKNQPENLNGILTFQVGPQAATKCGSARVRWNTAAAKQQTGNNITETMINQQYHDSNVTKQQTKLFGVGHVYKITLPLCE